MLHYLSVVPVDLVRTWGYLVIFISSVFESIPFLGLLTPGATIAHVGGFLAHQGELHLVLVLVVVFVGLFIGDIAAFYMGAHLGYIFLIRAASIFSVEETRIERVKKFVRDHTGKALTLGRFVFPVRVFASFVVGAAEYPLRRFVFFSGIGTGMWSLVIVFIGFFFGYGFDAVAAKTGKIFLGALVLGVLLFISFNSSRKLYKSLHRFEVYAAAAIVGSIFLLGKLIEDLVSKTFFARLDQSAYIYVMDPAFHNRFLDIIFTTASFLFNSKSLLVLTIAATVVLMLNRLRYETIFLWAAIALGYVSTIVLKELLEIPRPPTAYFITDSFSFPSGHTSAATVFFLAFAYILSRRIVKPVPASLSLLVAIVLTTIVGVSRMYLGVHWISDVIGGMALGVLVVGVTALTFEFSVTFYGRLRALYKLTKGR